MDFDGVDIDFLTDDEVLSLYNDVLGEGDSDLIASWREGSSYCDYLGYGITINGSYCSARRSVQCRNSSTGTRYQYCKS